MLLKGFKNYRINKFYCELIFIDTSVLYFLIFSQDLKSIVLLNGKWIPPFIDNTKPYRFLGTNEEEQNFLDAFNFLRTELDIRRSEILFDKMVLKVIKKGKKIIIHSFVIEGHFTDVERAPNIRLWTTYTREAKVYFYRGFKNEEEMYYIMISALINSIKVLPSEVLNGTWNPEAFEGIEFFDGKLLALNERLI